MVTSVVLKKEVDVCGHLPTSLRPLCTHNGVISASPDKNGLCLRILNPLVELKTLENWALEARSKVTETVRDNLMGYMPLLELANF